MMREDDPRLGMRERDLQDAVIDLGAMLGWTAYHTHDSRKSLPGFPDLVIWHVEQRRTVFAELKSTRGRLTATQTEVLDTLQRAGNEVFVWRPIHWLTGAVELVLKGEVIG